MGSLLRSISGIIVSRNRLMHCDQLRPTGKVPRLGSVGNHLGDLPPHIIPSQRRFTEAPQFGHCFPIPDFFHRASKQRHGLPDKSTSNRGSFLFARFSTGSEIMRLSNFTGLRSGPRDRTRRIADNAPTLVSLLSKKRRGFVIQGGFTKPSRPCGPQVNC